VSRRVVIGVGNPDRRDDGVGPAVAAAVFVPPGVVVVSCPAEPTAILDAWDGSELAVLVDAAVGGTPGRVRSGTIDELGMAAEKPFSSHDLSLPQTYELARALGRAPGALVVVTVEIADAGHGVGLSPPVAAALPEAVRLVERLVGGQAFGEQAFGEQAEESRDQQP
jgi:hydrogenase maturation protease